MKLIKTNSVILHILDSPFGLRSVRFVAFPQEEFNGNATLFVIMSDEFIEKHSMMKSFYLTNNLTTSFTLSQ